MHLEKALIEFKKPANKKDILEILWVSFRDDYENQKYYIEKINKLPKGNYFFSDLDWTFFRWVLQKEAFTLFVKYVKKQDYLGMDLEDYYNFLKDLKYFNELEKSAYNKQIEYFEYLNAWIYLMLKHKHLVNWDGFLNYIRNSFQVREKVNPFRFSFQKIQEVLEAGDNFVFISWAPSFIFDIYLEWVRWYVAKNIGQSFSNSIYGFGSYVDLQAFQFTPLWGKHHKSNFIDILKEKNIIQKTLWAMGDTSSDFGLSYGLDNGNDFYFVNPEKKVIDSFEEFKQDGINYHLIIERKDLICELKKEDIRFL